MKSTILTLLSICTVIPLGLAATNLRVSVDGDKVLRPQDVPAAPREPLTKLATPNRIKQFVQESHMFEAERKVNGLGASATVTGNGELINSEQAAGKADAPEAVRQIPEAFARKGNKCGIERIQIMLCEVTPSNRTGEREFFVNSDGELIRIVPLISSKIENDAVSTTPN